jgi:hypothetical protein
VSADTGGGGGGASAGVSADTGGGGGGASATVQADTGGLSGSFVDAQAGTGGAGGSFANVQAGIGGGGGDPLQVGLNTGSDVSANLQTDIAGVPWAHVGANTRTGIQADPGAPFTGWEHSLLAGKSHDLVAANGWSGGAGAGDMGTGIGAGQDPSGFLDGVIDAIGSAAGTVSVSGTAAGVAALVAAAGISVRAAMSLHSVTALYANCYAGGASIAPSARSFPPTDECPVSAASSSASFAVAETTAAVGASGGVKSEGALHRRSGSTEAWPYGSGESSVGEAIKRVVLAASLVMLALAFLPKRAWQTPSLGIIGEHDAEIRLSLVAVAGAVAIGLGIGMLA